MTKSTKEARHYEEAGQRRRSALPSVDLAPCTPTPFSAESTLRCAEADPDLFFDDERAAKAVALCSGCPARQACLAYALGHEEFGVWGGATPAQRDALRGGSLEGTPEDRRVVSLIHERVARGDLMPDIAVAVGVNQRTLYRWLADGGRSSAGGLADVA